MVSFKDYEIITDLLLSEATVSAGKYGEGSLFILKSSKIDTFNKKVGSQIKLPDNPVFSKLDPNKIPENALVLGNKEDTLRAAFDILDSPEGKSFGSVAWYEKTVDTYFNNLKLGTDINWGGATTTLETAQSIGVFYKDIESDSSNRPKVIEKIKAILSNGQDWDTKGKSNLLSKLDSMTSKNYNEMVGLISGMIEFMDIVKFSPNIIHGRINDYYTAEEENENVEITGVKANTADMIISSADADKTIKAMSSDSFTFDKNGVITGENSKIALIQVSLKKSADKAQLGKVTAYLIQKYGLPSYNDYFTDIVNECTEFNEGVIDFIKKGYVKVKDVFSKISSLVKSFFAEVVNRFKNVHAKEKKIVFKRWQKLFSLNSKDMFIFESYIENPNFLIEKKVEKSLNDKLENIKISDANKLVKEVQNRKKEIIELYNTKDYLIHKADTKITAFKNAKEINIDTVAKLLSNSYSLESIKSIIGSAKTNEILNAVIDMHKEVFFGKTSLPLYKVYGKSNGKSWEYLGSADDYVKKKKEKLVDVQFPISGIRMNAQNSKYLNIDLYVVSDVVDDQIYYTAFRTGTNASGRFSFNFEGAKQISHKQFVKFLG